jgi:hypothetical protein
MGELRKLDQGQPSGGFGAEEPSSFGSRETPVVSMAKESLLEVFGMGSPAREDQTVSPHDDGEPNGPRSEPAARLDPAASLPAPASRGSRATEQEFWDKPPAYSLAPRSVWPRSLWPSSLRPKPSAKRSRLAWLLFALIVAPVLLLFGHMLSIRYGIHWLDLATLLR